MSADLHGSDLIDQHIALLRARNEAIVADTMATLSADMDAALAKILGTPERELTVAELARHRDALRDAIFHDAEGRN